MTLKELAQELNMSTTTVSRVLSGQQKKYRISEKTALKVRKMAVELNFAPNQIAQNLRLQRTNTIGLIIPDISNPFFANLARAVEEELRRRGKMVLLCDTKDELALEEESLDLLLSRRVDGLLIAPVGDNYQHLLRDSRVPIVLLDRYFENTDLPFVSTDNYKGAYEATTSLISKGHTNISCIQGIPETSANQERLAGFRQALEDHEIPIKNNSILGHDYSFNNGYESSRKLLSGDDRPTAIFALSNLIAMGSVKAIQEAGLKIPDDISLLSFDDQTYFELLSPPISAIRQPVDSIGKNAVDSLFQLMKDDPVENKKLSPLLIERESVKKIDRP